MKKLFVFILIISFPCLCNGNNIEVTNITYNSAVGTVTFNISWENSWRISTAPNNWDAAWVFIKRRNCADPTWKHQYIATVGHSAANPLEVQSVPDSAGVFVRRSTVGNGTIAPTTITVKLANVPLALNEWDFKVFAVEMVYVPQGAFYLGSGSPNNFTEFRIGGITREPYLVTSEDTIGFYNTQGNLWDGGTQSTFAPAGNRVEADFPKGFRAFYAMKYELSQGQYTDFLNSLPQDIALSQEILRNGAARNTIGGAWPAYTCTAPTVAMNFLGWANLCSYLDWSGLAPMSEMEFEKLCRGTVFPVSNEYAWGTSSIQRASTLVNNFTDSETVVNFIPAGAGLCNYDNGGILSFGPFRVGFAAKNATSRAEAGAGYYGNMELSGNLYEFCTAIFGNASPTFKWTAHGDGLLTPVSGFSNVTGWVNQNATSATGAAYKGGSWNTDVNLSRFLTVSDRAFCDNQYTTGQINTGGRGVRRLFN